MTHERGDVVEVADPFTESNPSRPFVIVSSDDRPFHDEQYVAMSMTTRTWYDERIALSSEDFVDGGVPAERSIVPWGLASPKHDDVRDYFGRIRQSTVDDAVDQLNEYLHE